MRTKERTSTGKTVGENKVSSVHRARGTPTSVQQAAQPSRSSRHRISSGESSAPPRRSHRPSSGRDGRRDQGGNCYSRLARDVRASMSCRLAAVSRLRHLRDSCHCRRPRPRVSCSYRDGDLECRRPSGE